MLLAHGLFLTLTSTLTLTVSLHLTLTLTLTVTAAHHDAGASGPVAVVNGSPLLHFALLLASGYNLLSVTGCLENAAGC